MTIVSLPNVSLGAVMNHPDNTDLDPDHHIAIAAMHVCAPCERNAKRDVAWRNSQPSFTIRRTRNERIPREPSSESQPASLLCTAI
jgi:hypothetical protein